MKKPTISQRRIIEEVLRLNSDQWLVRKWRAYKGGTEVCLIHRETGEKHYTTVMATPK